MFCGSKVRYFIENSTVFFYSRSGRKYSHTNSYNFAMTPISQDGHLTARTLAPCELSLKLERSQINFLN